MNTLTMRQSFLILFLLVCLACSAQTASTELTQQIERQVRVVEQVPVSAHIYLSSPRASEFSDYDALTVTIEGDDKNQNYEFLLSKDRKTLVHLTTIDLRKNPYAEVLKKIDVKGRPVSGNLNGKVVVVSYNDFQCPFCSRVHQTLFPELLQEYGDRVAFIYKDFPLSQIHPWATHAAVNANCLASQSNDAYWDFADVIHSNQKVVNLQRDLSGKFEMLDQIAIAEATKFALDVASLRSCINVQDEDAIKESVKEGKSLGVSGTPVVFVNGEMIDGAHRASTFRAALDRALHDTERSGASVGLGGTAQIPPLP
jgi:protein-disulfide isomerase